MSESIFQSVKNAFTDKAVDTISRSLGEDAFKTKSGLNAMVPTVLGGILGKSTNATSAPNWWNTVVDMFDGDDSDELRLGMMSDPKLADAGRGLLGSLFGGNLDNVLGSLAGATGLGKEKSGKLLTTIAPIVIGFIGNWARKKGLSFGSIISNLLADKSAIVSALPAGIGSGILGLIDKPKEVYNDTARNVSNVTTPKRNFNWLWLLLVLGIIFLLWMLFGRGCNRTNDELQGQANEAVNDLDEAAGDVKSTIKGALNDAGDWVYDLGNNMKRKLADGNEIEIGTNSVESRLLNFIEDANLPVDKTTWFTLDRLYFESGSNNLKAESKNQLDRIADIMKAYPAVNLKIGGYTDNTGSDDVNIPLSLKRAEMARAELIKRGIAGNRLEAEGYGSQHPVCAANDTPECRAMNRRIDVRVTSK